MTNPFLRLKACGRTAAGLGVLIALGLVCPGCSGVTEGAQNLVTSVTTRKDPWPAIARDWIPPTPGGDPGILVPTRAAGYTLGAKDNGGSVQNLGVVGSGTHAHYLGANGSFDVYIFRAGPAEATAVFKQVINAVNQQYAAQAGSSSRYRIITGPIAYAVTPSWAPKIPGKRPPVYSASRLSYSYGPPGYSGALWWQYGWLFLAQTDGTSDPQAFLRDYLQNVSSASAPSFSLPGFKMPGAGSHLGGFHFHL